MKVIGAGFGRTGTSSIKAALEELGFGPCYHNSELPNNPGHAEAWLGAMRGEPVNWEWLFRDYRATADWPACTYYKELMGAFPDAKVLLSIRDPDEWYDSVNDTIYSLVKIIRALKKIAPAHPIVSLPPTSPAAKQGPGTGRRSFVWDGTFSGRFEDREHAIEVFNRHNEEVKRHVPPERLLVYEAKYGWEPLCEFLGVEVPEGKPFPRLNESAGFWDLPFPKLARETLEMYQEEPRLGARDGVEADLGVAAAVSEPPTPKPHSTGGLVRRYDPSGVVVGGFTVTRSHLRRARAAVRNIVGVHGASGACVESSILQKEQREA